MVDHEARQQAIERSKDPTRKRESDPKPAPYHYGSLLSSGSARIQTSTSTGITLSQNPFEGSGVGNRTTYMAQGSPLFTTVPMMGEFGVGPESAVVAGVGTGASGIPGRDGARNPMDPSESSTSCTSGTVPSMSSATTLELTSCRGSGLDYLPHGDSAEFFEVDIGGSRATSPPPHLTLSFGSWDTSVPRGRGSGASKRSDDVDSGPVTGSGTSDGGHGNEDEGQQRLLRSQSNQQNQRHTIESHTTATLVQKEIGQCDTGNHLRKRSGSPVSWASPARGTLFIVNQRNSEDI